MQLRVGVIGVGRMGQRHCRVYAGLRRTQLVGISDVSAAVGEQVAYQYGASYHRDVDDLLNRVDAVSLACPTPVHFDLAMHCIERGIHVLIEKPITETVQQAEKLCRAAESSGVVVLVGHIERFNPAYIELRNVLEDMTPLAITMRRLSPYDSSNTDVDVILDLMIHDLDLALDLAGRPPMAMSAYGLTVSRGVIDHAMAHLHFGSSPLLTIVASRVTEQKIRAIEVTAKEAYLECDLLNKSVEVYRRTICEYQNHNRRGVKYRQESIVERMQVPTVEPLAHQLEHFADCVIEGKRPLVPAESGLQALRLAMEIRDMVSASLVDLSREARSEQHRMEANALAS